MSSSPYNKDIFVCGLHNIREGSGNSVALFNINEVKDASKEVDRKNLKTKLELGGGLH